MVSVIILNYNRKDDIIFTLKKVQENNKSVEYEIIVVDQNSNDGSQLAIKNKFPEVNLFCSKSNLGVPGGRNKGAEIAKGDILVFLDDDSHFDTDNSILKIENMFNNNPEIGIIGFKVLDTNYNIRDWVYHKNTLKHNNNIFETQQFVGCGHAIRKSLFEKINGYSEELFFWGEEIEFCIKTFLYTEFKIIYYPNIEVIHRVSPRSRLFWSGKRTYYQTRNRFCLINTYFKYLIYAKIFYKLYYSIGYFIKAVKYSSLNYYIKGIKDSKKLNLNIQSSKTNRLHDYFKLHMKQLFGRVRAISIID